jgi:shikimate dehydrogenase
MQEYGLIGYPLSHSFSPRYFHEKFIQEQLDARYNSFSIASITELQKLIEESKNLKGLNVTIPYKSSVIPFLKKTSKAAKKIGAVNCIKIVKGELYGFNTDYIGFAESLKPLLRNDINKALVLGTGGSSKAVCYALSELGIAYQLVSSSAKGNMSYEDIDAKTMQEHLLIVNTTPLGMYPNTNECPNIPYSFLTKAHLLFDLVYNPEETLFIQNGLRQNTSVKNGLEMLHLQAEESWAIWNDTTSIEDTISTR